MGNVRRRVSVGLWIAACSVFLLLAAIPQRYVPQQLAPFVTEKGRFVGDPIRLATPEGGRLKVTTAIRIKMDQGLCQASLENGTAPTELFVIGEGSWCSQIPSGSSLFLDPQGNAGEYDVAIGPEWHPLSPKARRFILLPLAIGMIVIAIFARRIGPQVKRFGARRVLFLSAISVVSVLFFYPIAHEGGHMILGILFGAEPNWHGVVWTCLSGDEPHVSFSYLPQSAVPFMAAGGPIVPTLGALLLLLIWRFIHKNASWYVSAALVLIAILFLFSTVGCLFELYQDTHMDTLSVHLGLTGPIRVLCSLSPLLVAIAAYVWLGMKFRKSRMEKQQSGQSSIRKPNG